MIKLVATDMDGTLLDSNKQLPPTFVDWVKNHTDIKTVIASGRQYYKLEADFVDIKNELIFIAENGGVVFDKGEIIYIDQMDKKDILRSLELVKNIPFSNPIVCGTKAAYIQNPDEEQYINAKMYYESLVVCEDIYSVLDSDQMVKVAVYFKEEQAEKYYSEFDLLRDTLGVVLSGTSWIDIANPTENKGAALRAIMKKYNIDKSECMAFGDYLNDYDLLTACEESYCMENGHPDLKAIAKYIAESNDNDGVMKVLNTLDCKKGK